VLDGVADWDPDRDPGRHADAFGHAFLELFVRLHARGRAVTIGPNVTDGATVLVVMLEELATYDGEVHEGTVRRLARAALRHPSVVVVRADIPLAVSSPSFARCEVMPNRASIVDPRTQRWLPLLPQRGVVPRDPDRAGSIGTLAYKGYGFNVPSELRERSFLEALAECGVRVALDTEPSRWPDFRTADVALCLRRFNDRWDDSRHLRKPATKLVNAWVAGAIPLVAPQAAYLELVRPGDDALVVESPDEVVDAVRRLTVDADLVDRLRAGGAERGQEFTADRVLDAWEALFDDEPSRAPLTATAAALVVTSARAGMRLLRGSA
jgi:hypothetical protein